MTISNRLSGPSYRTDSTAAALSATHAVATMHATRRHDEQSPIVRGWREPVGPVEIELAGESETRTMLFGLPVALAAGIAAVFALR